MRILLIEDDVMVAAGVREALERAGHAVDHSASAEPVETAMELTHYDLAIVDIGLPGMSGHEFIRRIRGRGVKAPVLILTARDGLDDRVVGLDLGADDYMVKPFHLPELLARVRALIRRSRSAASSELSVGPLCLDLARRAALLRGLPMELTGREWDILQQLMLASPNVVSKQKMVESLSEWDNELTLNAIEIYVCRLRSKLRGSGAEVRTIRGIGYRLDETGPA
ncbi:response regulator [Noviherbaspirillum denitrificans]|uniref:Two-component system response regulator n=1 Tax=Noviherbaspirillum denitrificans TaxID=1968433 RepID=A0A254TIB5_9BURK|nr:response regulator [Noviherbaspirillum denitrificans]OWW20313.1 two-component system response regulator [Noviherbaspirillum denitrificans]